MTSSHVLVGGKDPDKIYDSAVEKTRKLREEAEAEQHLQHERARQAYSHDTTGFSIKAHPNFLRISQARPNQIDTWDLTDRLLNNGNQFTHGDWADHNYLVIHEPDKLAEQDRFSVPHIGAYFDLFQLLYHNRESKPFGGLIEIARGRFERILSSTPLMSMSLAEYNSGGRDDRVTSSSGSVYNQHSGSLTGPDGELLSLADREAICQTLFQTSAQEVNDVIYWLTGQNAGICRLQKPPSSPQPISWAISFGPTIHLCNPLIIKGFKTSQHHFVTLPALGIRNVQQPVGRESIERLVDRTAWRPPSGQGGAP